MIDCRELEDVKTLDDQIAEIDKLIERMEKDLESYLSEE